MKSNIEYILQIDKQNILQVHYSSGANRFIYPDAWGCYGSNMSKSQLDFMHNSQMYEMENGDGWGKSFYYYLLENSPLIKTIEHRNQIERQLAKC